MNTLEFERHSNGKFRTLLEVRENDFPRHALLRLSEELAERFQLLNAGDNRLSSTMMFHPRVQSFAAHIKAVFKDKFLQNLRFQSAVKQRHTVRLHPDLQWQLPQQMPQPGTAWDPGRSSRHYRAIADLVVHCLTAGGWQFLHRIVCPGDSIPFGARVKGRGTVDGESYPARLKLLLSRTPPSSVQ